MGLNLSEPMAAPRSEMLFLKIELLCTYTEKCTFPRSVEVGMECLLLLSSLVHCSCWHPCPLAVVTVVQTSCLWVCLLTSEDGSMQHTLSAFFIEDRVSEVTHLYSLLFPTVWLHYIAFIHPCDAFFTFMCSQFEAIINKAALNIYAPVFLLTLSGSCPRFRS